jgi:membrane protein implicated in regulation of membrane protease activity
MLFVVAVLLALFVLPSPWGLICVVAAAVVEIGETYFWFWLSRRPRTRVGAETMIGALARVETPCRPDGQVRVNGELWSASCEGGADPGDLVRIVGRRGLVLLVEPT